MVVAATVTTSRSVLFGITAWICRTCSSSAQIVSTAVVPLMVTAALWQRAPRIVSVSWGRRHSRSKTSQ
jgi:hypothetical protein